MPIALTLTEDQDLFHDTTVRFIEAELPRDKTRLLHDDPAGFDREWLRSTAELGWYSMLVSEDAGGGCVSGNPMADAALVAEELGRHVQPGPFIPMNLALAAVAEHGSEWARSEVVAGGIAGEVILAWAFADDRGRWDAGSGMAMTRDGGGYLLSGVRGVVQDAAQADYVLVPVELDGEAVQVLVSPTAPGVSVAALGSLDLGRRFSTLSFADVAVDPAAIVRGGAAALDLQYSRGAALTAVETVGAIDELLTMTVEYAKDRIAFGRPIGSFQALKHLMADLALGVETAKAAATGAIEALDQGRDDAAEVVSMAAAFVGEQGNHTAQQCLQIHGGIGYTWEHDLHLLMRRIQTNSALYGTPTEHRERICALHRLGEGADR